MAQAKATTDHGIIRRWVEERGGTPARVRGTGDGEDPGILRIDFPGFSGQRTLEAISWEAFFRAFEDNELAFLYQDAEDSRFSKLVSRENVEQTEPRGTDAVKLLEHQHREVEDFFEKIHRADSNAEKEALFVELANALAAHTKIEESLFYPAMFDGSTEGELRESVEEHLLAKRVLADLLDMDPSDPQFASKISVLQEVVRHHVAEEEKTLFAHARQQEDVDLQVLGRKMEQRYGELMESDPADELPAEARSAASPF